MFYRETNLPQYVEGNYEVKDDEWLGGIYVYVPVCVHVRVCIYECVCVYV